MSFKQIVGLKDVDWNTINPAREDGNLKSISDQIDVNLSSRASEITLSALNNKKFHDILVVAEGGLAGASLGYALGEKDSISAISMVEINQIAYAEPHGSGVGLRVVSSSADDTALGAGARKVHLEYLDADWVKKDITILMNGTTPVLTTVTDIAHIESFHVSEIGTALGASIGNISLQSVDGGILYVQIPIGQNISTMARHHVPAGKVCYLLGWCVSAYSGTAKFYLRAEVVHDGARVFHFRRILMPERMGISEDFEAPIRVEEKCHIRVDGKAKASNVDGAASFSYLEKSI